MVRAVQAEVGNAKFVFKSDVKKYYASMDHNVLMELVNSSVSVRKVRALILKSVQGPESRGRYLKPVFTDH